MSLKLTTKLPTGRYFSFLEGTRCRGIEIVHRNVLKDRFYGMLVSIRPHNRNHTCSSGSPVFRDESCTLNEI